MLHGSVFKVPGLPADLNSRPQKGSIQTKTEIHRVSRQTGGCVSTCQSLDMGHPLGRPNRAQSLKDDFAVLVLVDLLTTAMGIMESVTILLGNESPTRLPSLTVGLPNRRPTTPGGRSSPTFGISSVDWPGLGALVRRRETCERLWKPTKGRVDLALLLLAAVWSPQNIPTIRTRMSGPTGTDQVGDADTDPVFPGNV